MHARAKLLSWAQIADEERQREDEVQSRYKDALKVILTAGSLC